MCVICTHRYIFGDGELVFGEISQFPILLLVQLEVSQAAPDVAGPLAQLPVGVLQLLLPQQNGVHLLFHQSLLLPVRNMRDTMSVSASVLTLVHHANGMCSLVDRQVSTNRHSQYKVVYVRDGLVEMATEFQSD